MSKRKLGNIQSSEYDKVIRLCKMFNISGNEFHPSIIPDIPDDNIIIPGGKILVITNIDTEQEIPRITVNYDLRSRTIGGDLRAFIKKIIRCIEEFLKSNGKHIIHKEQDGKEAYIIVDTDINEISWEPNKNDAQVTFSVSVIEYDDIASFPAKFKKRRNLIRETLPDIQQIKQLHIGWVNGMVPIRNEPRIPGLGLLILFYAILQSYLEHDFVIKGSLDNDSDYNDIYKNFGFKYDTGVDDNKYSPEMSSSLHIEKIINDILPVICGMHPQICECIDKKDEEGKEDTEGEEEATGGKRTKKRKTKKRKSKRRKTKRRRKY